MWVSVCFALQESFALLKGVFNRLGSVHLVISALLELSFPTSILVQYLLIFLMPQQQIFHPVLRAFLVTTVHT